MLALALVFEGVSWVVAFRAMQRAKPAGVGYLHAARGSKDPIIFVVLFEDTAAMAGLLIALGGIALSDAFDAPAYDAIASLLIGLVLAVVAAILAYECKGLLIGESADQAVVADIRRLVAADRRVRRPLEVLTMHLGPEDVLLNLNVEFDDRLTVEEVAQTIQALEQAIRARHPEIRQVFVEATSLRGAGAKATESAPQ